MNIMLIWGETLQSLNIVQGEKSRGERGGIICGEFKKNCNFNSMKMLNKEYGLSRSCSWINLSSVLFSINGDTPKVVLSTTLPLEINGERTISHIRYLTRSHSPLIVTLYQRHEDSKIAILAVCIY